VNGAVTIRPARRADLAAVDRIEQASFTDPWSPAALATELSGDDMRLSLAAEMAGELVGYLMAWRVSDQLHILNLAVRPDHRRAGVGTALLIAAARAAWREGRRALTLEVRRSNLSARAFYRRHGFARVGVRPGYYPDTGEDALLLSCTAADLLPRGV
jgi:ribosomal-protein-alanine N-acetyltransferase